MFRTAHLANTPALQLEDLPLVPHSLPDAKAVVTMLQKVISSASSLGLLLRPRGWTQRDKSQRQWKCAVIHEQQGRLLGELLGTKFMAPFTLQLRGPPYKCFCGISLFRPWLITYPSTQECLNKGF